VTLLLTNEEIEQVLTMEDCVDVLHEAYLELARGRAAYRPRSDLIALTSEPGVVHGLKSMDGVIPKFGIAALRLNSDIINWPLHDGTPRREKLPAASGRWVGLVLLFSTQTGEPLAIFPDGVVQRMRVGATSALGARLLARPDARVLGLLGSGWQAGAQVMGMCAVRAIQEVRVYSPTPSHRVAFTDEIGRRVGVEIRPVDRPEAAVEGADIVVTATNSLGPVLSPKWLAPGMHIGSIRHTELDAHTLKRCDLLFIHCRESAPHAYVVGGAEAVPEVHRGLAKPRGGIIDWASYPELWELVAGRMPGRTSPAQITCFANNIGTGLQFAAVGARVLELGRRHGLGRELPTEWFLQTVHP
jgi:alanine dehydrogenase